MYKYKPLDKSVRRKDHVGKAERFLRRFDPYLQPAQRTYDVASRIPVMGVVVRVVAGVFVRLGVVAGIATAVMLALLVFVFVAVWGATFFEDSGGP